MTLLTNSITCYILNSFVYAISQVIKYLCILNFLFQINIQAEKEAAEKEAAEKEHQKNQEEEKVRLIQYLCVNC